ncbi:LysR family transcriptional regulator [Roseibium sp.]|uniref:LysR family transcriptional regulator n=1 Tax=Roseibium sp. TaxID=1936156 RepID=UPI003BAEEE08
MRIKFDFQDLEIFLAVMDTASFHAAAGRLNMSQPAVTRRIQKLEDTLGSDLFERSTRSVKPTLAAKRLQARAEAMLDSAEETTLAMRDESVAFAYQQSAVVTLAMIPSAVTPLLIPALHTLRSRGELVRLRLLDRAANEVAEAVSQGDADFGVCSLGSLEPNTDFAPLFDDEIALAVSGDHSLADRKTVHWSDLLNEPLILPARGTGNRLLIDDAMARSRLSAQWTFEVGRTTTAMELVGASAGVALLPRSAQHSELGKQLVFKTLKDPEVTRPIGLLARQGAADSAAASILKAELRNRARLLSGAE